MRNIDQFYMQQALTLASRGKYTVSPNPMVGCIIVKNGAIVGHGWHIATGQAHAEVYALKEAGIKAKGATVYITLEPCCHFGRTPPCVDALIKAKVSKVIIATLDPNPQVSGKGIQKLKDANISVEFGLLQQQAQELNKIFFHYHKNSTPFVFAKWAMSLDGKTVINANDSKQISSTKTNINTHQLRNICDAILIGKNTLIDDNPTLNSRLNISKTLNPIRFILFTKLEQIDLNWQVLDQNIAKTIFVCSEISDIAKQTLKNYSIEYWLIPIINNKIDLKTLLKAMGNNGISSILVEGGRKILDSFIDKNLVNEFYTYISAVTITNSNPKKHLYFNSINCIGKDILINAKPEGLKDV